MQGERGVGKKPDARAVPEQHRSDDADDGYRAGRRCDRLHLRERGFEADFEQQQHDSELREKLDRPELCCAVKRVDAHQVEVAEDDACAQLAKDGGLIEPYRDLAAKLRREDHPGEDQPDFVAEAVLAAARPRCGGNHREESQKQ